MTIKTNPHAASKIMPGRTTASRQARRAWLGGARQAGRHDLDARGRCGATAVLGEARRPCRHARSARIRLPADRARRGDQDRSLHHGRPQDLSLHRALGRGTRHRRCRRPRRASRAPRARTQPRSARCCRDSPARSSRCRRAFPRSRSKASVPMTSPATARWSSWRAARSRSTGWSWSTSPDADHAVFEAECGKGTYVRALARDFGRDLGCFGHVSALRRDGGRPLRRG